MPNTPVDAPPFVPVRPLVTIDAGSGNTISLECAAESFEVSPDQSDNTITTFCGAFTTYSPETWTITGTAYISYGADGLWTLARPLVGVARPFTFLPDAGSAPSVDNPQMSGMAILRAFDFYNGSAADGPASFDLVLSVQGEPSWSPPGTAVGVSGEVGAEAAA